MFSERLSRVWSRSASITKKRKVKAREHSQRHNGDLEHNQMLEDAEDPTQRPSIDQQAFDGVHHTTKRISCSWRWNVDPDDISAETLSQSFKRPSDLFAFHTLPIVGSSVQANAKRRDIRLKTQSMMDEMPQSEYDKWMGSFQKLQDGHDNMLVRIPSGSTTIVRTAAILAPLDSCKRAGNATRAPTDTHSERVVLEAFREAAHHKHYIKSEGNDDHATTSTAFRHLPTEEHNFEPKASNRTATEVRHSPWIPGQTNADSNTNDRSPLGSHILYLQ
jgi:hypothetical protein